MPPRLGLLVIHGMGSQEPGFSRGLERAVARRLGPRAERLVWQEIHWADALEQREDALWDAMRSAVAPDGKRIPLDWRAAREFVVHNFGDAIAYHRDFEASSAYEVVHGLIGARIRALADALADPSAPVVVLAHSLGAHMMSNYVWDRQHPRPGAPDPLPPLPTLAGMITFGCNIPLFSLAYPVAKPIDLPGEAVTDPALRAAVRWLNFLDRDDVLGWPLKPLYAAHRPQLTALQRDTVDRLEDHAIRVGGLLGGLTPWSHSGYWTDRSLVVPVAEYLGGLLAAMR